MDIIIIIFNIISLVVLAVMLLKGYFSGLWKSLVSLGILVVGIIILSLCVNPIGNAIANPENVETLQAFINEQMGVEGLVDPRIADLTLGIAAMIVKMTVLFSGMAFLICVLEPVISLIVNSIVFGKKKAVKNDEEDEEKGDKKDSKQKRPLWVGLGGLGVKFVHFFVVMIALFIPLFAVNSLVLTYEDTVTEIQTEEVETIEIFNTLNKFDKSFVKAPVNAINKIFKTNLEIKVIKGLSNIKVGDQRINIIDEVCKLEPLIGIILDNKDDEDAVVEIIIDGKEELANYIRESTLLETIYPVVIDFIELNDGFSEDSIIKYEDLIKIDFANDKNSIANIIIIVGEYLEKESVNFDDISTVLSDPELPNVLKSIGLELANTTFKDVVLKLAQGVLNDIDTTDEDLSALLELIDLTKITNDKIGNDMYNVGVLLNKIDALGITSDEEIDILQNLDVLEEMISTALKLSIIEGSEDEFIKYIFENYNFLEGYEIDLDNFDFNLVVSWDAEIHALFNIVDEYLTETGELNFNVEDLKEISGLIKGPNGEPCYFTNYIIGCIIKIELEKVVSDDILDKIEGEYDITDPEDFEELTGSLGAAIEVGTSIEKLEDVEALSSEEISNICDTIAELDNHKSELLYDLVVDLTASEGIVIDVTEEEFMSASLTKEAEILEEILTAITNDVSEEDIDALLAEAEEKTVIIKAFIEQYIK